jgi:hypothetical protein
MNTVAEIHKFPGGAKLHKFPTKLSNFRRLEKTVFSPILGQNFRKFGHFSLRWGGGGGKSFPCPIEISATAQIFYATNQERFCSLLSLAEI